MTGGPWVEGPALPPQLQSATPKLLSSLQGALSARWDRTTAPLLPQPSLLPSLPPTGVDLRIPPTKLPTCSP